MTPEPEARRLRFPLGPKLGLLMGLVLSGFLAVDGWLDLRAELERAVQVRRQHQEGVARAAAELLDGALVASWTRAEDMHSPGYQRTLAALRRVRRASGVRWLGIYGRDGDRYHYILDGEEEAPNPLGFPFFDPSAAMEAAFGGAPGFELDLEDEWGRWDAALAPIRVGGEVVAVLSVDVDADWRAAFTRQRQQALATRVALSCAVLMGLSIVMGRLLNRPLRVLTAAATAVQRGDLEHAVNIRSRDELELLGSAFNRMIGGLKERDRMREAFGRYVTPALARRVLEDPEALRPGGRMATVTILMSDLRGFTDLSARRTPQEMVALLNAYLQRMSEVIEAHGGTINEFIGDAILALFGAPESGEDDALRAVRCAAEMQRALEAFNAELGGVPLEMGVGINTGPVVVGNIGSAQHVKWGVVGDAVNMAARVESLTVGGEVLVSEATWASLGGAVRGRGPIEAKVKGRAEPLRLFAVQEVEGVQVPGEVTPAPMVAAQGQVRMRRLRGKQLDEAELTGQLLALGEGRLRLRCEAALAPHAALQLRVEGGPEGVYVRVVSCEAGEVELRVSSAPPEALAALAALREGRA